MPVGLQVWDASGTLILNFTDRLSRLQQTVSFSVLTNNTEITYSIPGNNPNDSSWFLLVPSITGMRYTSVTDGVTVRNVAAGSTGSGTIIVLRG